MANPSNQPPSIYQDVISGRAGSSLVRVGRNTSITPNASHSPSRYDTPVVCFRDRCWYLISRTVIDHPGYTDLPTGPEKCMETKELRTRVGKSRTRSLPRSRPQGETIFIKIEQCS